MEKIFMYLVNSTQNKARLTNWDLVIDQSIAIDVFATPVVDSTLLNLTTYFNKHALLKKLKKYIEP